MPQCRPQAVTPRLFFRSVLLAMVLLTILSISRLDPLVVTTRTAEASPTGRKVILIAGNNSYCTENPCLGQTASGSAGHTFKTIRAYLKHWGYSDDDILIATYSSTLGSGDDPHNKTYTKEDTHRSVVYSSSNLSQFFSHPHYQGVVFDIIGYSLGGVVAADMVVRYPSTASRIHSIITLDSPLQGISLSESGGATVISVFGAPTFGTCNVQCDLLESSNVITGLRNAAAQVKFVNIRNQLDILPPILFRGYLPGNLAAPIWDAGGGLDLVENHGKILYNDDDKRDSNGMNSMDWIGWALAHGGSQPSVNLRWGSTSWGLNLSRRVTLEVRRTKGGSPIFSTTVNTDVDGNANSIALTVPGPGVYDLYLKTDGFVNQRVRKLLSGSQTVTFSMSRVGTDCITNAQRETPAAGDFDGNNVINAQDYNVFKRNFNRSAGPGLYDIDGDGTITGIDYNIYLRTMCTVWKGTSRELVGDSGRRDNAGLLASADVDDEFGVLKVAEQPFVGSGAGFVTPSTGNFSSGQEFDLSVYLDSSGAHVEGADAVVRYDPAALRVVQIVPTSLFSQYTVLASDSDSGEVNISALANQAQAVSLGVLATVRFQVIGYGSTNVTLDFQPFSRARTGMAEEASGEQVLAYTLSATYTLPTAPTRSLTVSRNGSGSGSIVTSPPGIDCGSTCAADFTHGAEVTMMAIPDIGSRFSGWGGACAGTANCTLTMDSAKSVTATFETLGSDLSITMAAAPDPVATGGRLTYTIAVRNNGPSSTIAQVQTSMAGINQPFDQTCPGLISLTGPVNGIWGVECSLGSLGVGQSVAFTLSGAVGANGGFTNTSTVTGEAQDPNPGNNSASVTTVPTSVVQRTLTVVAQPVGTGNRVVTTNSVSAVVDDCTTCSLSYPIGTTFTLTPKPAAGYTFLEWRGACTGAGACQVTLDSDKSVSAYFAPPVGVQVGRGSALPNGDPTLVATLTARAGCGPIDHIQFGQAGRAFANARVSVTSPTGGPTGQTAGFTYTPPAGTTSVSLMIQRTVQGGGATVNPIHFYDGCGEWSTFVGGGPDAFR
jgi:hypothetical protein